MDKKNYVVTFFAVTQVKVDVNAVDVDEAMEIGRSAVERGAGMWIYEETQFDDYVPIVDEVG